MKTGVGLTHVRIVLLVLTMEMTTVVCAHQDTLAKTVKVVSQNCVFPLEVCPYTNEKLHVC